MSKKITLISVAVIMAAGPTFAGGHLNGKSGAGNSEPAQEMATAIQEADKGIASTLRDKPPSDRGWGNGGSDLFGTQVSKSGKPSDD